MPHTSFLKKLFKSKASSARASESSNNKKSSLHGLSALKTSTKARCHALRNAFRSASKSSPGFIGECYSTDDVDISRCLPAVDAIGTDLQLNFDQKEDYEGSTHLASTEEDSQAAPAEANNVEEPGLLVPVAQCQRHEHIQPSTSITEPNRVEVRNSITITS
jgi:hypothetical protein